MVEKFKWSIDETNLIHQAFGCRMAQVERQIKATANPQIGKILQDEVKELSDLLYRIVNG